jgi:hypothetical protein
MVSDSLPLLTAYRELITSRMHDLPLSGEESWGEYVLDDLAMMDERLRGSWLALLRHTHRLRGTRPSQRWSRQAAEHVGALGGDGAGGVELVARFERWLRGVEPRGRLAACGGDARGDALHGAQEEVWRGLVWASESLVASDWEGEAGASEECVRRLAAALGDLAVESYRKVPGRGPRSQRVGNACIMVLARMPAQVAAGQLAHLRRRIDYASGRERVAAALARIARRERLTTADLEELAVPDFGLDARGERRQPLGTCVAIVESGAADGEPALRWETSGGAPLEGPPASLVRSRRDEVRALERSVVDLRRTYDAQRARLEGLYLRSRSWSLPLWRARMVEHPLLGALAARLIWEVRLPGGQRAAGIPRGEDRRLVDADGAPLALASDGREVTVRLWHPARCGEEEVERWRTYFEERSIESPFVQAHRDVYGAASCGEFSGRALEQHQFSALCRRRGWHYRLQGLWESEECATRELPDFGIGAALRVLPAREAGVSEGRTFLRVVCGALSFYELGAERRPIAPGILDEVLVSEVARDADLFVSVSSVDEPGAAGSSDGSTEGRDVDAQGADRLAG